MPLRLGKLGVATKTYYVQKAGFPFYDACQLIGAMHLFFGSGTSQLRDVHAYWELSGPVAGANMANYGERLKNKGLERIEQTTLSFLEKLEDTTGEIQAYFEALPPKTEVIEQSQREGVSRYLEPAWLTGARGQDATAYGILASQRGIPSKRPAPELRVATLGLTQAALAYGNDEALTVLPVLQDSLQPMTPFITFRQRYQHGAGGAISAVFASLGILVDLGKKYRIQDFAFAYHGGRGFYYSGLLGLSRLCSQFGHVEDFARQVLNYLERTRSADAGVPLDLARQLAQFLKNPALDALAAIARSKARLLADEELAPWISGAASELLGTTLSIKEALTMVEDQRRIPPPSEGLVRALGEVFKAEKQGAWIGAYINLERAHKPDEFYAEVGKILSRALSRAESDRRWLAAKLRDALALLTAQEVLEACEPANLRYFSAHKTTFLLRILSHMKYQPGEQPKTFEDLEGDDPE